MLGDDDDDDDGRLLLLLLVVWSWAENGCVEGSIGFATLWMRLGDVALWTSWGGFVATLRGIERKRKRTMMDSCDDAGHGARRSCMSWRYSI